MLNQLCVSEDELKAATLYKVIRDEELLQQIEKDDNIAYKVIRDGGLFYVYKMDEELEQIERDDNIAMDEETAEKLGLKGKTYD